MSQRSMQYRRLVGNLLPGSLEDVYGEGLLQKGEMTNREGERLSPPPHLRPN
jgi:hypothetical protein